MLKEFDIIIIGGGLSGLFFNYKLKQTKPELKTLLIEKNKIGGRAGNDIFYGTSIVTGAGIGRYKKDKILWNLIHEFGLETHEFIANKDFILPNKINFSKIYSLLKKEFKKQGEPKINFKEFAKRNISPQEYISFIEHIGYTDFENEDCYEVFNHYGMLDNILSFRAFSVPWSKLVNKLQENIISMNSDIINETVLSISGHFKVKTNVDNYKCNHVVVATDIDSIRKLLKNKIYNSIKGQPFIRTYGKFTKSSTELISSKINKLTCVVKPLQKIIPMANGIFMIAYADNDSAIYLNKFSENTKQNRAKYTQLLFNAIGLNLEIIAIRSYYWQNGTHYYIPPLTNNFFSQINNPQKGIYVIGEAVSRDQGWSKGAFETANNLIKYF